MSLSHKRCYTVYLYFVTLKMGQTHYVLIKQNKTTQ